ncbi:hypothetical protein FB451DRAFT_1164658 [Mycena latifolia]|nr:hypothetical protein FB451DRAFT_1164658 [Mycena latifolia]
MLVLSCPRSRYHGFTRIHLAHNGISDDVATFLDLIASPVVTIVSSIREVQLYHQSSSPEPSAGDIISLLWRSGVHPKRLDLNCDFAELFMRGPLQDSFASVTHLRLVLYDEAPVEKLFDYLFTLPSLQSLVLRMSLSGSMTSMHLGITPRMLPPNLHELRLAEPTILRSLLSLENPPSQFSVLVLSLIDQWEEVNPYLAHSTISATLKSLTLEECYTDSVYADARSGDAVGDGGLDLSRLDALRHLRIDQHYMWMARSVLAVLASIRGSSPSRPLEMIELSVELLERMKDEKYAEWRDIDTALADSGMWPHLRRLAVSARNGGQDVDFPGATMCQCASRGGS